MWSSDFNFTSVSDSISDLSFRYTRGHITIISNHSDFCNLMYGVSAKGIRIACVSSVEDFITMLVVFYELYKTECFIRNFECIKMTYYLWTINSWTVHFSAPLVRIKRAGGGGPKLESQWDQYEKGFFYCFCRAYETSHNRHNKRHSITNYLLAIYISKQLAVLYRFLSIALCCLDVLGRYTKFLNSLFKYFLSSWSGNICMSVPMLKLIYFTER